MKNKFYFRKFGIVIFILLQMSLIFTSCSNEPNPNCKYLFKMEVHDGNQAETEKIANILYKRLINIELRKQDIYMSIDQNQIFFELMVDTSYSYIEIDPFEYKAVYDEHPAYWIIKHSMQNNGKMDVIQLLNFSFIKDYLKRTKEIADSTHLVDFVFDISSLLNNENKELIKLDTLTMPYKLLVDYSDTAKVNYIFRKFGRHDIDFRWNGFRNSENQLELFFYQKRYLIDNIESNVIGNFIELSSSSLTNLFEQNNSLEQNVYYGICFDGYVYQIDHLSNIKKGNKLLFNPNLPRPSDIFLLNILINNPYNNDVSITYFSREII